MQGSDMSRWTVYMLRCSDKSLYTGITTDIEKRLKAHLAGTASKYTRVKLPVKLVWSEPASSESTAKKREAAIKKLTRKEKVELIGGNSTLAK